MQPVQAERRPSFSSAVLGVLKRHRILTAASVLCVLTGCAKYAEVVEKRPRLPPPPGSGMLALAEKMIAKVSARRHGPPLAALHEGITALETISRQLQRTPGDAIARRDYNFTLSRIFTLIREAKLDPWTHPLRVGEYTLTTPPVPASQPEWNPALYDFTPSDQLDIRGSYITERTTKAGLGATLVARRCEARQDARAHFVMDRPYYGVTAVARFEGRRCVVSFIDPLANEHATLGRRTFPLAADYSAPLAVMLDEMNPRKLEFSRMLRPEKYADTARIARLQAYDPHKTVVLVIHGLASTPATWIPMLNSLQGDAEIRRNFQFWFFSYPSGYPYPYSAAILRRELDAVEKKYPLQKPMVLIGHSMGGVISRLMITDSGDRLWQTLFGRPPAQTPLSPKTREVLADSLIFRHRPEVGRAIFISAPHRGSEIASNWLGRLASSLIRTPGTLLHAGESLKLRVPDSTSLQLTRIPNSIDTLAPNNRFVKAVNTIPMARGIPYHTIAGDRGRGDAPDSSDGVVPYWSSHIEGAQSELIVPSDHSSNKHPEAIREVSRILKQHTRQ